MTTKRWLGRGGVVVLLVLGVSAATSQGGLVNPHLRPEPCMSCHSKVPSEAEARAGQYFHLQPTIDETCKICHSCCKTGVRHLEMNHPTDLADWDRSRFKA
ncbi:MAG: hypothetical protein OEV91_01475, partial [Desulfobulbaceae bacterium]|nr:hypothetical protein [Desulfobulbaceae bacterium]